jgi:hypothetical protein
MPRLNGSAVSARSVNQSWSGEGPSMPRLNGSAVSAVPCAFSLGAVSIAPADAKGGVPARAPAPARGGVGIVAPLAGPPLGAAGLVPVGMARYWERGVRELTCEVHNVGLPNFTLCTLSLNGTPLVTTPLFAGVAVFPILSTLGGEVVPVCQPGDVVTITAAGFGPILAGAFGGPPGPAAPPGQSGVPADGPRPRGLSAPGRRELYPLRGPGEPDVRSLHLRGACRRSAGGERAECGPVPR